MIRRCFCALALIAVGLIPTVSTASGATLTTSANAFSSPFGSGEPFERDRRATAIPGVGGFYIAPDGTPTVHVTSRGKADEARAMVRDVLDERPTASLGTVDEAAQIRVLEDQFDLAQLATWKDRANELLLAPGTVLVDIDETENRVLVGVASRTAAERAQRMLNRLDVPSAAVEIEQVEPVRFEATVRDRIRPARGGLQIAYSGYLCTLGFNARDASGTLGFVTNSHCSFVQGSRDSSVYYQPAPTSAAERIGTEFRDPGFWSGSPCPSGRLCRYSDANFARYDAGVNVALGRIARTEFPGSITLDPFAADFRIVSEATFPMGGERLEKVGRTTGWTSGTVTNTCVNVSPVDSNGSDLGITLLCQDIYSAGSNPGDSGSPVFRWNGADAALFGIHWGSGGGGGIFSSFYNVEFELGNLITY